MSESTQDITAIRDFVKMFYDRAETPDEMPKYLLLFGDGSYDYKNRIDNNTNYYFSCLGYYNLWYFHFTFLTASAVNHILLCLYSRHRIVLGLDKEVG